MGYRVDYRPMDRAIRKSRCRVCGWPLLWAVFFLCFLVIVCSFWDEGREVLCRILFPGDWIVVEEALARFQEAVRAGDSAADCLETFCRRVLVEANIDLH